MEPARHQTVISKRSATLGGIVLLGVATVITQLALLRELLGPFAGNELVLGIALGNWLLLTGLGASLGRTATRLREPSRAFVIGLTLLALIPPAQIVLVRVVRDLVFIRGALVGVTESVVSTFVLLLPFCLVSGYLLTLGCDLLARGAEQDPGDAERAIGRVYIADSLGSIAGGALFTFVLVHWFDHFALLCLTGGAVLVMAALAARALQQRVLAGLSVAGAVGLLGLLSAGEVDTWSTARQFAGQQVVFRGHSPYGRLVVTGSAGQLNFIENGVPLFTTYDVGRIEETVHYAMAQRPDARRALLVAGGVAGTAREILRYGVDEVTYVELDPLILEVGRQFLPENVADSRIHVVNTDGRLFVRDTRLKFDVIIIDVPEPSTLQLNRFYTGEFYSELRHVMAADGVLGFALGRYENYISPELAGLLRSAHETLRQHFRNVRVLPGGRVYFLASDGPLTLEIAARIAAAGIQTRLVNRHYLDAMLTPDRFADLERAVASPAAAAINTDLNPVLYLRHLRHWISQFRIKLGVLEGLLILGFMVYVVWLRPVPRAILAGGFAASALEVVLLLAFQILYGSVYLQLGVLITTFMAGLAAGARWANRCPAPGARQRLLRVVGVLGLYALVLPFVLWWLTQAGGDAGRWVIPGLTFLLAVLVGMEFPWAGQAEPAGAAATAARLYPADFVGACLGALLVSTLLIPLIGVVWVCVLTAALNLAAGFGLWWTRAAT